MRTRVLTNPSNNRITNTDTLTATPSYDRTVIWLEYFHFVFIFHFYLISSILHSLLTIYVYVGWRLYCLRHRRLSRANPQRHQRLQGRHYKHAARDPHFKIQFPLTHLVCYAHLIANFLGFHMSLVVVVNCGAGNVLHGFEISVFYFFLKLYFIHIFKGILLLWAQNAIKQCEWYISIKPLCQGLRLCKIGKSATQLLLLLYMISKNSDFGVGGCKIHYRSAFFTHEHKNHHSEPKKLSSNQVDIWNTFWYINEYTTSYPSWKSGKQARSRISLSQLLIITQRYLIKFTSRYMFLRMTNTTKLDFLKKVYVSPNSSKSKTVAYYGQIIVLV